jgi:hypothetical protein
MSLNNFAEPFSSVAFWENQPTDKPWLLNGFRGTFAYSDHSLIPEPIQNFLIEFFYSRLGEGRKNWVKMIPLEEINQTLNEIWEGPGSMAKLERMKLEMRNSRISDEPKDTEKLFKNYETPTIESDLAVSDV